MINKNAVPLMLALLLAAAAPGYAASASTPVASVPTASAPAAASPVAPAASGTALTASGTASAPARIADASEFPLLLKGTELLISRDAKRETLSAALTKVIGESTEMEEKTRLQYDFQVTPESSPVGLVIDWDEAGKIVTITLDGEEAPTKDLLAWLKKQAGAGKPGAKEEGYTNTVWEHRGWTFTFRQGGSNEDTAYSITIAPQKAK